MLTNFNHRHFLKLLFFCILRYSLMVSIIRESYRYLFFKKNCGIYQVVFPQRQVSVTRRITKTAFDCYENQIAKIRNCMSEHRGRSRGDGLGGWPPPFAEAHHKSLGPNVG